MKWNRKWIAAGVVVAVLVVPFVIKKTKGDSGTEVEIALAAEQEIRPTILASGTLAYRTEINLTSELLAKVTQVLVEEGDTVVEGQPLIELDPKTYQAAIDREEASQRQGRISIERQRTVLALRERQFERSKQLIAAKMIDQNRFDEDRNQFDLAKVELKSSEEALRRASAVLNEVREQLTKTEIRSPISGTVVALTIKVGETAIPSTNSLVGAQLMKIADTSSIQAELKVDEADIANIVVGQHAEVFAAAYQDDALKGVVERVALAPTIEGQGRAYLVRAVLEAPENMKLRSGMSARANIFLSDGSKKIAVPVEAITTDIDKDKKVTRYVWLARDGKAEKVEVEVGVSDDRWQEIVSGVLLGDSVITGPGKTVRKLIKGELVSAKEEKGEAKTDEDEESEEGDEQ